MDLLIKAVAAGAAAGIAALLIRRANPELSLVIALAASALVLALAMRRMCAVLELVEQTAELSALSPAVLAPVLKCVGIGIVARLGSELCRDAGQGSVAASVELLGAVCALCTALPLFSAALELIGGMT